jgi:hypothetical protein
MIEEGAEVKQRLYGASFLVEKPKLMKMEDSNHMRVYRIDS